MVLRELSEVMVVPTVVAVAMVVPAVVAYSLRVWLLSLLGTKPIPSGTDFGLRMTSSTILHVMQ
jgi:hypothetical protein